MRYRFLNQNVVQGPSTDFNEDGSVLRKNFFDKNGDLHGETLVWGGPGWPKPHKFSYSHGKLHGRKQLFDKDGNLLLDVTYHEGKLDQPMRPASGISRNEMIAVFAPVGVVDLRVFRDGDRFFFVRIDKQELFELIGEPDESVRLSDYDNIPSLVRYCLLYTSPSPRD